ncbi:MAG: hypothetical protein Q8N60_00700, partial [Candidatus Diapherotrites archaeon]|nr:hypothetical protein [Candidatus Diapherotrites archaeon]
MAKTGLLWRRANAFVRWRSEQFEPLRNAVEKQAGLIRGHKLTGSEGGGTIRRHINIKRYGKLFLTTFPTHIVKKIGANQFVLSLCPGGNYSPVSARLFTEKIGFPGRTELTQVDISFERKAVFIEFMLEAAGSQDKLKASRETLGEDPIKYTIETIERHARDCGFKQAKIGAPKEQGMHQFYERVAGEMGYKREGTAY